MIGAIAGDVIGSVHEGSGMKEVMFPLLTPRSQFTADAVLTVATASAILTETPYGMAYHAFGRRYPNVGYGPLFALWLQETRPRPYHSFGNGAATRVAPVGFAFSTLEEVLIEAERSGDADTQAAIAGGIAHAFYRHVPAAIDVAVRNRLPGELVDVIDQFQDRFAATWWPDG